MGLVQKFSAACAAVANAFKPDPNPWNACLDYVTSQTAPVSPYHYMDRLYLTERANGRVSLTRAPLLAGFTSHYAPQINPVPGTPVVLLSVATKKEVMEKLEELFSDPRVSHHLQKDYRNWLAKVTSEPTGPEFVPN
jgi:hypothetical protein